MAIALQQRIQEDVSDAKRNLFCEVHPLHCPQLSDRSHARPALAVLDCACLYCTVPRPLHVVSG